MRRNIAHTSERDEGRLDMRLDALALLESGRDRRGIDGARSCRKRRHDRGRAREFVGREARLLNLTGLAREHHLALALRRRGGCPNDAGAALLVLRAKPPHVALSFLGGSLLVERHKARDHFLVAQLRRPPISFEDDRIELVVKLLEDKDEPLVLDALGVFVERRARSQLIENSA
jgi:hypothetical protein